MRYPFVPGKKFLAGLITALFISGGAFAANAPLVLNTADREPYFNGDGTGFYEIIIREAASRADIPIVFNPLPSERSLINAAKGVEDGEFARIAEISKHHPSLVRVDEPLVVWNFTAFVPAGAQPITSWDDMAGKDVACVTGWRICESSVPPHANLITVPDDVALASFIALGRTDVGVLEPLRMARAMHQAGVVGRVSNAGVLASRPMYLFLHEDNARFADPLAAALAAMKEDGTYNRILSRFTGISE